MRQDSPLIQEKNVTQPTDGVGNPIDWEEEEKAAKKLGQKIKKPEVDEMIGKVKTSELGSKAVDLFEYKRLRDKAQELEKMIDLSNVREKDSPEEQVFKMYEQLKAFNLRIQAMRTFQKELKQDLKSLEE